VFYVRQDLSSSDFCLPPGRVCVEVLVDQLVRSCFRFGLLPFSFPPEPTKSEFGIDFSSCCVDCYREKPVVFLTYRIKKLEFSRF
jgi:hypothetical protein